jgi:hypothetical protein
MLKRKLFDNHGNLSILKMLDAWKMHQFGTSVHSEHILAVDSKFDKGKWKPVEDDTSDNVFKLSKLSMKEGSHQVCVAQDFMRDEEKPKKIWQMHWLSISTELTRVIPSKVSFPYNCLLH